MEYIDTEETKQIWNRIIEHVQIKSGIDEIRRKWIIQEPADIYTLVLENGGAMRQTSIRKHCAFSAAKVSLMIKYLVDNGCVKTITTGREHVVMIR